MTGVFIRWEHSDTITEGRPREKTGTRRPPASQGESPQNDTGQPWWHLDLALLASRTLRKWFLSPVPPICGSLLCKPHKLIWFLHFLNGLLYYKSNTFSNRSLTSTLPPLFANRFGALTIVPNKLQMSKKHSLTDYRQIQNDKQVLIKNTNNR